MLPILVKVGFPSLTKSNTASLCVCHGKLVFTSYTCPQCSAITCNIPSRCKCCQIYLVSPADVCRGFHHLCAPPEFTNVPADILGGCDTCASCSVELKNSVMYSGEDRAKQCPGCMKIFCR